MKLAIFSLAALTGSTQANYAAIYDATDLSDYNSIWTMKQDPIANGGLWLGDAAIFFEGPDISEIVAVPMWYGGNGMLNHRDNSPGQEYILDESSSPAKQYKIEKYVLKNMNNRKLGQVSIYNHGIVSVNFVDDNLYKAKLQISASQTGSTPPLGSFGDYLDPASNTNVCHFKLKSDKLYDFSEAKFQCGTATLDCDQSQPQRGWGSRNGSPIKNTFWMGFDKQLIDEGVNLLATASYTTSCNNGQNVDEFFCEYDSSYYGLQWLASSAEEC